MDSLIHIVLATYNGERFIREQLDSILAGTIDDISIEICDDGSTDRTLEIVREYEKKYECIQIHENKENAGYVRNFLEGIKRSRSPYIMLCDQDDIWDEDKIARTLAAMKKLEQSCRKDASCPLLVFTDAMNYDDETGRKLGAFHENSHLDTRKTDLAHLLMENKCIGCTVMVNAAVIPYLDTMPTAARVHDWWLALICSCFGKIYYLSETTLQYRQHHGNMIGGSGFLDYVKNRMANLKRQREALEQTFAQGEEFYLLFKDKLGETDRKTVCAFSQMKKAGPFRKRWYVIRFGFYKSGFMRNAALFLVL